LGGEEGEKEGRGRGELEFKIGLFPRLRFGLFDI
jgi:hypothetical protein